LIQAAQDKAVNAIVLWHDCNRALVAERHDRAPPKSQERDMAQLSTNELLASLGADKVAVLLPYMKVLELPQETVLFETGDPVKTVYFPLSGIISIVVDLASGEMIEAAMIGKDGLVGGSAALDHPISLNRAVAQVAGAAATMLGQYPQKIA
jgi:Cyclic nucleotide-binding domain